MIGTIAFVGTLVLASSVACVTAISALLDGGDYRWRPRRDRKAVTMPEYEDLLLCWRSGQISERQWIEHLRDEAFAAWLLRRETVAP